MSTKNFLISAATIVALLAGGTALAAGAAKDPTKKHHVVFQLNDADEARWNMALNNVNIMMKTLGKENVEIALVANGGGLDMLMFDSSVKNRLGDSIKMGITFSACGQTMAAKKVTAKDLYPGVQVVPGGNIEVMEKQEAGWTYLKI
ncbi:MAG: DsrE family protein [Gammaproteobacteria bacterium]|nr:DsrE family protein [Gammaproteobacteria bacterium]